MGNRYWITGAQIGLLTGLLECDNWDDDMTLKEIKQLISTIQDEQFIVDILEVEKTEVKGG